MYKSELTHTNQYVQQSKEFVLDAGRWIVLIAVGGSLWIS